MDIGAYSQIDDLDAIATANDVNVPRLRGYRLMRAEKPITKEDIKKSFKELDAEWCEDLIMSNWRMGYHGYELSARTRRLRRKYLKYNPDGTKEIRWDKIHGWRRKTLKFELKKNHKDMQKQWDMFNKYAGKDNVLMIHARLGAANWDWYECDECIANQPWFLDMVEDGYDCTYCDIYAKVDLEKSL